MRLENDAANRSKSPPQSYRHGTSRSPISKPHSAKIANGDTAPRNETNGAYSNGNSIPTRAHLSKDFDGHSREEVTRIIIQGLTDLGYHDSARALSDESGYQLEGPTVASFKKAVLQGDWVEAEALLFGTDSYSHGGGVGLDMGSHDKSWVRNSRSRSPSQHTGGLPLAEGANRSEMLFWIRQQKYLEALERRDIGKALMVLRQELAPLNQDVTRLHALSGFVAPLA